MGNPFFQAITKKWVNNHILNSTFILYFKVKFLNKQYPLDQAQFGILFWKHVF